MGHIVENQETDELDYEVFFTHGIPKDLSAEEWRAAIGNRTWKLYHGVMDHYPCPTCKEAGQILLSGIHDMVNLHTDKPLFDRANVDRFLELVHEFEAKLGEHTHEEFNEQVARHQHEDEPDGELPEDLGDPAEGLEDEEVVHAEADL